LLNADEFNKIRNNFIANGRETLLCSG